LETVSKGLEPGAIITTLCIYTPDAFGGTQQCLASPGAISKDDDGKFIQPEGIRREAAASFAQNRDKVIAQLNAMSDGDFANKQLSTPFGIQGSAAFVLQLMTDHQNNHKHDLFIY